MGWGDDIMVSSIAKRVAELTGDPVVILDANCARRHSEVWNGLDYISDTGRTFIVNGPSARHYYSGMSGNRILWRKWDIAPGEIRLTDEERAWAKDFCGVAPFIVMEPRFKKRGGGGVNKDWGIDRWDAFWSARDSRRGYKTIRMDWCKTPPTFRHACAILERSIGYVGHEGGLHHAAAALGKKAVVVFGGYISPEVTGYSFHRNLYTPDERYPLGCGTVAPCEHCREAQAAISVEQVVEAVKEMVNAPAKK